MKHLLDTWSRRIASVSDYGGRHQPPDDSDPLYDLGSTGMYFPKDVYDDPSIYVHRGASYSDETIRVIEQVRGKPDAMVTIYRTAPPGVGEIETGNWVALAKSYVELHRESNGEPDWEIYAASVPAKTVRCGENDLIEWGYWGPTISARTAKLAATLAPYFHGTNAVLHQGDHIIPGLGAVHGNDNDVVWVASNAWVASAYGAYTYQVEPDDEPRKRGKAGEFRCSGAVVIREITRQEIIDASNAWMKMGAFGDSPEEAKLLKELADAILEPVPRGKDYNILPPAHELYGGYISQDRSGRLLLDGEPVKKLYRVVHPKEWEEAQRNGYLQSNTDFSPGYTRASAKPDERWRYQSADSLEVAPRGLTLEITYDQSDGWNASAEGYAATHSRIPLSRVRKIG